MASLQPDGQRIGWKFSASSHRTVIPWLPQSETLLNLSLMRAQPTLGECHHKLPWHKLKDFWICFSCMRYHFREIQVKWRKCLLQTCSNCFCLTHVFIARRQLLKVSSIWSPTPADSRTLSSGIRFFFDNFATNSFAL